MKIMVIIGAAPDCIADIAKLPAGEFDYMAIGLDAVDKVLSPIQCFATYHPGEIKAAKQRRAMAGGNTDYIVISHQRHDDDVDVIISYRGPSGSSAMLGILAAMQMGYDRIICCGCPLTDKKYKNFRPGWEDRFEEIKNMVRSMSGWTKELLGAPTMEWLNGR
jgi:hypothetical protein